MMSIRSLADFNRSSLGGDGDWLTPPPSPPRPHKPGRHDERGMGTFNWPLARTSTWPYTGTFSWPRTRHLRIDRKTVRVYLSGGRVPVFGPPAGPDRFGPFAGYCRIRFADDPHLQSPARAGRSPGWA